MRIKDIDIRRVLFNSTLKSLESKEPGTKIVEEFSICQGDARIDIAAINGRIHGFEIKSESDDLRRLPDQIEFYNKVFDRITIVIGRDHLNEIKKMVPLWWGIIVVEKDKKDLTMKPVRDPIQNFYIESYYLAQLLWRDEAISILKQNKLSKGLLSKPRKILWKKLSEELPLEMLKSYIIETLKTRPGWRGQKSDFLQKSNGD